MCLRVSYKTQCVEDPFVCTLCNRIIFAPVHPWNKLVSSLDQMMWNRAALLLDIGSILVTYGISCISHEEWFAANHIGDRSAVASESCPSFTIWHITHVCELRMLSGLRRLMFWAFLHAIQVTHCPGFTRKSKISHAAVEFAPKPDAGYADKQYQHNQVVPLVLVFCRCSAICFVRRLYSSNAVSYVYAVLVVWPTYALSNFMKHCGPGGPPWQKSFSRTYVPTTTYPLQWSEIKRRKQPTCF